MRSAAGIGADDLAREERPQLAVRRHLADHRARELPPPADLAHARDVRRRDDGHHPLLRLGDHDLPRLEARLPERDAVEVHVHADLARHLRERRREARRTAVLEARDEVALDELQRDLDQRLSAERVPDLDGRALLVRPLEILRGEDRRASDPVASRERAEQDDGVPDAGRVRPQHALGREQPDAHRVHERVLGVRLVERGLAADGRHPDAVSVVADPGDGAAEVPVGRAEPERVEERDRARAHRDDVAQDPADSRRRSLERLDGRRVVVRLDLERDGDAAAEVHDAGVLARPLQHAVAV